MLPLGKIMRKNSSHFHCYADDTQLYISMKLGETNQLSKLEACLQDIKTWMTRNILLLNLDKTKVIVLGLKHLRENFSSDKAALDSVSITPTANVRNLGVQFDQDLSFLLLFQSKDSWT